MAPERESPAVAMKRIEPGPPPHGGVAAIGARDGARGNRAAIHVDNAVADAGNTRAPKQMNAGRCGAIDHQVVQSGPADAEPVAMRKISVNGNAAIYETDPAERVAGRVLQRNAQGARGADAIRHDAFPARFIDGRRGAIGESDVQAALPRRDGSGKSGRSAADDEQVGGSGVPIQRGTPAIEGCIRASS
jgi:hypothetical protein